MNPHFTALEAAYQLHYYLCFKTHYLRPTLATNEAQLLVRSVLEDVCAREQYHLLESETSKDHLRLLVSLRPNQTVSRTVRMLKGNLQFQFGKSLGLAKPLAKGYFARTSGSVDLERVRQYVDGQATHHGFTGEWTKALEYRNREFQSPAFSFDHCVSILNYHFVFTTQNRIAVFDETIAERLFDYVVAVGDKHNFAVDRVGLLPDHMHLIIEGIPSISVEDYALAILNNTRYWIEKNFSGVLKETGAMDVWQPSYYAGTVGEYTTAQVNSFLRS